MYSQQNIDISLKKKNRFLVSSWSFMKYSFLWFKFPILPVVPAFTEGNTVPFAKRGFKNFYVKVKMSLNAKSD